MSGYSATLKPSSPTSNDLDARLGAPPFGLVDRADGVLETFRKTSPSKAGTGAGAHSSGEIGPSQGRFSEREARLENTVINSSAPRRIRERKWIELDYLRLESTRKAQRSCLLGTRSKTVGVRVSGVGAGYSGLMHCGFATCPNCAPQIGAVRREDINAAVTNHRAMGGEVLMLTMTLRHNRRQSFETLRAALSKCWDAATSGRGWRRDREEAGIVGVTRVWEEKWSISTGWHLHVHALLFVRDVGPDSTPCGVFFPQRFAPRRNRPLGGSEGGDPQTLLASLFGRWQRKALEMGLDAPLLRGQDLHVVTGEDVDVLGGYFAKQATEDGARTAEEIAWELSNPDGKSRGESFTPAEIRSLAVDGDPQMQALWGEYEQGMAGRRTIAWTRGLRDLLGLDEEKSDQEIVDEADGGDVVLSMTAKTWWKFARQDGMRFELLRRVTEDGAASAVAWARSAGFELHEGDIAPPGGQEAR
jgi:hypothetical protein